MKTIAATLFFGLLSAQSAMAAESDSYSGHESVNNNTAAACTRPVAQQAAPVPVFQMSYQLSYPTTNRQSSYTSGSEHASGV